MSGGCPVVDGSSSSKGGSPLSLTERLHQSLVQSVHSVSKAVGLPCPLPEQLHQRDQPAGQLKPGVCLSLHLRSPEFCATVEAAFTLQLLLDFLFRRPYWCSHSLLLTSVADDSFEAGPTCSMAAYAGAGVEVSPLNQMPKVGDQTRHSHQKHPLSKERVVSSIPMASAPDLKRPGHQVAWPTLTILTLVRAEDGFWDACRRRVLRTGNIPALRCSTTL